MRCRHFTIRLSPQGAAEDEARLNQFLDCVRVQNVQTAPGAPGGWSILVFYDEPAEEREREQPRAGRSAAETAPRDEEPALTPEQRRIYDLLREWRSQRAAADGKPPYVIAHNAVLMQIARQHMTIRAADDLLSISQLGPARAARYGPDILAILAATAARDEAPLFEDGR